MAGRWGRARSTGHRRVRPARRRWRQCRGPARRYRRWAGSPGRTGPAADADRGRGGPDGPRRAPVRTRAEMLRKEPHDKGVSCPGPLVQGSRVRQRQLDDPQGFPHLCGQAVDEDPPLGEELRGVAAGVVAALADPDPRQGHERGELAEEPVPAAHRPRGVGGAWPVAAGAGRSLAGAQLEAEAELGRVSPKDAELRHTAVPPCPPGRFAAQQRTGLGAAPDFLRLR